MKTTYNSNYFMLVDILERFRFNQGLLRKLNEQGENWLPYKTEVKLITLIRKTREKAYEFSAKT